MVGCAAKFHHNGDWFAGPIVKADGPPGRGPPVSARFGLAIAKIFKSPSQSGSNTGSAIWPESSGA